MKIFKRILVSLFAFVMVFTMVGCGKNNDNNENNNNNNNQNTNPPEVVYLTTSQVLGKVYNKIKTSLTKTVDDNPSFADGDGYSFYNEFVYAGITILNEVSKYEGLVEDKVLSSDEFVLTVYENNYANKIDRFYIKNDKNNEVNKIDLTIIASRKKNFATNNLDSILINYEINYNETTDKCLVNCVWEKSYSRGEEDSEATYYSFLYDDSDEDIKVYSFFRDGNIDLSKENYLHGLIKVQILNFSHIYFNLKGGYKWSPSSPSDNDITDPLVQEYIIEVLSIADTSRVELSLKDVELEKQEFFTAKILYVINSSKIADFDETAKV